MRLKNLHLNRNLKELRNEAINELKGEDKEEIPEEPKKERTSDVEDEIEIPSREELAGLNVHKLRHLARSFPDFPIKGREISRHGPGDDQRDLCQREKDPFQ